MSADASAPSVSMVNTKKEMLEAYTELKRIFEVETAAIDLAALLQAHKAEREKFAVSMAQHRAELETEMAARKQTELQGRLADLTNQIQAKQAAFDEQVEARERDLTGREDAVTERERTLDELRARVEAFPNERDEAVARAIKETTSRLQAEHGSAQKLLTKEFEGKVQDIASKAVAGATRTIITSAGGERGGSRRGEDERE